MAEMMGVRQPTYGDADVLEVVSLPRPTPGPDDVIVKVRAGSLNFGDKMMLLGRPYLFRPLAYGLTRPSAPVAGMAAAGVVVDVGSRVGNWAIGDPVFGELSRGALAEFVAANPGELVRKPEGVRFEDAATLPVAATTALSGLRDVGELKPSGRVLVNGASGGVGTFAIMIAKALGGRVTAVCRAPYVDQARELGADRVIDADAQSYLEDEEHYDLVFDLIGNHRLGERRRMLTPEGIYVSSFGQGGGTFLGPLPGILSVGLASMWSRRVRVHAASPNARDLTDAAALVAEGRVRPVIERRFRLDETPEAYRQLLAGGRRGKLVITIDDPYAFRR